MISRFIQAWFTWIMVVIALLFALLSGQAFVPTFLCTLLFFEVGMVSLWAAAGHLLQPEKTAASIGWISSPFQREMGFANLALAVVGFIAPWQPLSFKLCVILVFTILWWGCAYGHIKDAIVNKNYAVHNTGPMLYTSISMPILLGILFVLVMSA